MKRILVFLSVLGILCSLLLTGVSVGATADTVVALSFTEQEMEYQDAYAAWGVDGNILTGSWSNWGYVEQTCAAIRKLVMPRAGTFKLETIWGTTGVTVQNAADSFDFVILNNDKEIIWPQTGGWFTVTASTPAEINLELAVEAGDAVYFVFNNGSTVPTPYTTASVLCLDDYQTRLDNGSGGYGAADITAQGNDGWYYLYATDVTELTAADLEESDLSALNAALDAAAAVTDLSVYTDDSAAAFTAALTAAQAITDANTQQEIDAAAAALTAAIAGLIAKQPDDTAGTAVALEFTEQEMNYIVTPDYSAWGVNDDITGGIWSNWGYANQTYASIRKLVMPRAGTFKLETIWGTTGVTVQNAADSFDFVILNNDKEIIWPQTGGWFTVTASTPAEINLELAVEAGDAVYFVFNNGSTVPTPYTTASVLCLDDYQTRLDNGSGGYGAADISAQGNDGWYYLYATDVTEVTETEPDPEPDPEPEPEPEPELPPEDANDPTVALQFTEQEMTYDATLTGWTADADNNCVIYPWASVSPKQNGKVAIRKFVAPIAGDLILKWGNGISVDQGKANFAITDKYGKILYGKVELTAGEAHVLDCIIEDVEAGDVFYFVAYNHTVDGAVTSMHSAVNIDSTAYAENGNLANSANTQGASGWYYVYATDLTEVKASEYKTFVALDEQIAAAEAIPADRLALYSDESVKALTDALAAAEALTEENTQAEIDAATAALEAAIKGLTVKATADNVNKVTFTEKEMTFNTATGYWAAADDAACIITAPLNYPTPVTTTGLAAIRKLVMPQDGSLEFKWGNGVYIDNTSGRYTGATAEFAIADKDGNIVYPQDGGVAVIEEGTPLVLDFALTGLKKGDALYFLTFNPSMENVPVVYNFAVMLDGTTSLQNEGGSLYEADKQGDTWYFGYASDVTFTAASGGTTTPGGSTTQPESPETGDAGTLWLVMVVLAASVLLLGNKFCKGEGRA